MGKTFTIFLCLLLSVSFALAGTTGKIAGRVTDKTTGEPLVGANIIIVGTLMGAGADLEGDYFILNIPPGTYELEVSMVGYARVTQQQISVGIDRTTTINFEVDPDILESEEIVVVADRFEVKPDVSNSEISATKAEVEIVPLVQSMTEYLGLQAGIDYSNTPDGSEMFVRGQGGTALGMVVNGLPIQSKIAGRARRGDDEVFEDAFVGGTADMVNLSAVEEVSVLKGGFNAEYGNIRSGLLNVVTKEGVQKYSASVNVQYTPAAQKHRGANLYSHDNFWLRPYLDPAVAWVGTANGTWDQATQNQYRQFIGWNAWAAEKNADNDPNNDITPEDGRNLFIWQHAAEGAAALGHPHQGSYGDEPDYNVDLSLGGPIPWVGQYLGDMTFFLSFRDRNQQYTFDSQLDGSHFQNWMLKLTSKLSPTMKFAIEAVSGINENQGPFSEGGGYYIYGTSPTTNDQDMIGLTFDHVLSPSTFYKVRINYFTQRIDQDMWRTARNLSTVKTFGINDGYPMDEQPYGFWVNPTRFQLTYGDGTLIGGPGGQDYDQSVTKTIDFKFDITSQMNKYNQVQGGIEVILEDYNILSGTDGFSAAYETQWTNKPYRIQGYLQDKLEFEGFIANLGLRGDYYSPSTVWYGSDPYSKYYSEKYYQEFREEIPKEDAKSTFTVSPRLGVAHPITESSKLYFNYGHFYSMGIADQMYEIFYVGRGRGLGAVGNSNLLPARQIAYELGYEQEFADMFLLRVTGYYKDIDDEIAAENYVDYEGSVNYTTYQNDAYSDIRGVEIELRKNWGNWVTGWLNYTYQVVSSGEIGRSFNYQDPRRQISEGLRNPIQDKPLPQPYFNANVRFMSPKNWGPDWGGIHWLDQLSLNFLVRWASGDYITWDEIPPYTEENNLQWKSRWNIDLRFSKFFAVSDFDFSLFLDVINVFDIQYLTGGFWNGDDERDYLNSLHLPIYSAAKYQGLGYTAGDDQVGDVKSDDKPYINMPNMNFQAWNPPRSIILGLRISF